MFSLGIGITSALTWKAEESAGPLLGVAGMGCSSGGGRPAAGPAVIAAAARTWAAVRTVFIPTGVMRVALLDVLSDHHMWGDNVPGDSTVKLLFLLNRTKIEVEHMFKKTLSVLLLFFKRILNRFLKVECTKRP